MRVVTSGLRYLDIDAYAGCIAYAELLRQSGQQAVAASNAPLNESISPITRQWKVQFENSYHPSKDDTFTILDVSDPAHFDDLVDLSRVDEVIDHHLGFETYWQKRPDVTTQIEYVGAACTQVYERWEAAGLLEKMSESSARLLICGILDNTLNFGAEISSDRDHRAYSALQELAELPPDWPAQYFSDCQAEILADITTSVRNDSKILEFQTFDAPVGIGQLVVWDGRAVLRKHEAEIKSELRKLQPDWFMNLISLSDKRSYLVADEVSVVEWLSGLLKVEFDRSIAVAPRPWLRKEIVKRDIDRAD